MVEPEEPQMTSQHGAYALHVGKAALHERITHAHAHAPRRSQAPARAHTHTQEDIYCFSKATMTSEGVSELRYTYIVCIVC